MTQVTENKKNILIFGATGSVGISTLAVIRKHPQKFNVTGLSCNTNVNKLVTFIEEFKPKAVFIKEDRVELLLAKIRHLPQLPKVFSNIAHLYQFIAFADPGLIICAVSQSAGMTYVLEALENGIDVAVANKEPLVMAGNIIVEKAKKKKIKILPMDSEHNAIYQMLANVDREEVRNITLTASGGPFFNTPVEDFSKVTLDDVLKHPTWKMGTKITVDSATTMNKALEVIEAHWLFKINTEQIGVIVHPKSIVHSFINFIDGTTVAQIYLPDMQVPISYCLGLGKRISSGIENIKLEEIGTLQFFALDESKFPCVGYAKKALQLGGAVPACLNAANELLVNEFIIGNINFVDIFRYLKTFMRMLEDKFKTQKLPSFVKKGQTLEDVFETDKWARHTMEKLIHTSGNH